MDAKIISKVIASRTKNVLPYIIHHNQTGYVKDRFIGETIPSTFFFFLMLILNYTYELYIETTLLIYNLINTEHPKLHYTSKLYGLYTIQHIAILQYQFKLGVGGDSSCSIMGKI